MARAWLAFAFMVRASILLYGSDLPTKLQLYVKKGNGMSRALLFMALFSYALIATSAEIYGEKRPEGFAYPSLYFVSGGEPLDDSDFKKLGYFKEGTSVGAHYRVGFIISEIYTSFLVELITFGEENMGHKIRETYMLSSNVVADAIGNRVDIVEVDCWITPRRFRISLGGEKSRVYYEIDIGNRGKYSINAANPKS